MKENKSASITFKLTEVEKQELEAYCQETGLSMSMAVRMAIRYFLQQNK